VNLNDYYPTDDRVVHIVTLGRRKLNFEHQQRRKKLFSNEQSSTGTRLEREIIPSVNLKFLNFIVICFRFVILVLTTVGEF